MKHGRDSLFPRGNEILRIVLAAFAGVVGDSSELRAELTGSDKASSAISPRSFVSGSGITDAGELRLPSPLKRLVFVHRKTGLEIK